MNWLGSGSDLHPLLDRVPGLTRDALLRLADGWDAARSHRLRDRVAGDIQLGWEFGLFPAEAFAVSDLFESAARDAGLGSDEKERAWEAIADLMMVQLLGSPSSDIGRADHRAVIEHWQHSTAVAAPERVSRRQR